MSETLRGESLRASTSSSTSTCKQLWNLQLDEDNLELNLNLSPSPTRPQQRVCTMEMVERALKTMKKKPMLITSSFSSLTSLRSDNSHSTSSSSSTSSHAADSTTTTTLVMGACTRCLIYVMLHKSDPKCPSCEIDVPLDSFARCKRQRVDAHSP